MSTINGIGTAWRGVSNPDESGIRTGTRWVTFFYLPLFPLSRHRFRYGGSSRSRGPFIGRTTMYNIYSKEPLNAGEIVATYVTGWIIFPALLIGPTVAMMQMQAQIKYRDPDGTILLVLIMGWLILCAGVVIPLLSRWMRPASPQPKPDLDGNQ